MIDPVVERVAQRLHRNLLAEDGPYSLAQGDFPLLTLDGTFDCRELATWAVEATREPPDGADRPTAPEPRKEARQLLAEIPGGPGYDNRVVLAVECAMNLEWWRGHHSAGRDDKIARLRGLLWRAKQIARPWMDGGITWPEWDALMAEIEHETGFAKSIEEIRKPTIDALETLLNSEGNNVAVTVLPDGSITVAPRRS